MRRELPVENQPAVVPALDFAFDSETEGIVGISDFDLCRTVAGKSPTATVWQRILDTNLRRTPLAVGVKNGKTDGHAAGIGLGLALPDESDWHGDGNHRGRICRGNDSS